MTADSAHLAQVPLRVTTVGDLVRWCFLQVNADARVENRVHLATGSDAALVATLSHHRGWGAFHAVRDRVSGVSEHVLSTSARRHLTRSMRHLSVHADLQSVAGALGGATIPWLAVKGPVLADLYYPSPEHRPYGDLDILVMPSDLRCSLGALQAAGFSLLDKNWTLALERMSGEVHLASPQGTVVDLHWSLQNRERRRRRLGVDTATLFERAVAIDLPGIEVQTLSWPDTVVHLALHAAGDGADRLIWLSDVAQVMAAHPGGWTDLVARSLTWRAGRAMETVLQRATRELGLPVPRSVLRDLNPNPLTRLAEATMCRAHPVHELTSRKNALARWTRYHLEPRTITANHFPGGLARHAVPFTESPTNPYSLLYDDGGPGGLDRYLRAVEATAT